MHDWQRECRICPRRCGANRTIGPFGTCGEANRIRAARAALHHWEEPPISGTRGSGTIFFSGCNLRCVFCQNAPISQLGTGIALSPDALTGVMLDLQQQGAHNINLVSGTPFTPLIAESLTAARSRGLAIPVVWNSNAYELQGTLRLLRGLVDIYLPDLKYAGGGISSRYSGAEDYFGHACAAIEEMMGQVGAPALKDGLIQRGLVIRHLILPGNLADTKKVLDWIAGHLPHTVYVSLMAQYTPMHEAGLFPELGRRLRRRELDEAFEHLVSLGLENGFVQEPDSADASFTPPFDLTGLPHG